MTYFKDLSVYIYSGNERPWPLENNVGWLGPDRSFSTAKPDETLLDALWKFCKVQVRSTRGIHLCHLCMADNSRTPPFES